MKTIRQSVFETNSSSVHSISVKKRYNQVEPCQLRILNDGYVHISLDEFGWGYDGNYYGQEQRLSYILTQLAAKSSATNWYDSETQDDVCRNRIENEPFYREIENCVIEHIDENCNGIYIDSFNGYVDHQSIEENVKDIYLDYGLSLSEFLFGSHVELIIDNDNH